MTEPITSDGGGVPGSDAPTSLPTSDLAASPASPHGLSDFELVMREYRKRNPQFGVPIPSSFSSSPQVTPPEENVSFPHVQLPDETWVKIFEYLPTYPSPERRDRWSGLIQDYPIQRMSRTCKRMRAIALPLMFSDIYLTTPTSVVRTVSQMTLRPDLIPHVRRLDIYVQAIVGIPHSGAGLDAVHEVEVQRQLARAVFGITSILAKCSPLTTTNYYGAIPKAVVYDMLTQLRLIFMRAKKIGFERDLRTHRNFDRTSWVHAQFVQNILSHCCAVEQIRLSMLDSATFTKAYAFPRSLRALYVDFVQLSPDTYAVWLSELTSLEVLHISEPLWAGADFTSLIVAFGKFGPNLKSLVIDEGYMTTGIHESDYFRWATATSEMVKCCSALTELHLKGVCYRAIIVHHLPETLVSLVMGRMQFGAGQYETMSYVEFVDGLIELPNLKKLAVNHNYAHKDNVETAAILRERGVQSVNFNCWVDNYGDDYD